MIALGCNKRAKNEKKLEAFNNFNGYYVSFYHNHYNSIPE